jgi:osmotically-inducible protein OsmY
MFRRIIMLCLVAYCLNGCVGVFLAGAATGGLAVYDRRNLETLSTDQHIRYRVLKRISEDAAMKKTHITAASFHKMLLLTGQVPTSAERIRAEHIARTVPHIKELYNEITISSPTTPATRTSDSWITVKVKTDLLGTKDLRSGDIKVVTEDSTVFLLGKVTKSQAEIAVDVARKVSGVKKIVKVFHYIV